MIEHCSLLPMAERILQGPNGEPDQQDIEIAGLVIGLCGNCMSGGGGCSPDMYELYLKYLKAGRQNTIDQVL